MVEKMYPAQLGISYEEYKSLWLRLMFTDEACNITIIHKNLIRY